MKQFVCFAVVFLAFASNSYAQEGWKKVEKGPGSSAVKTVTNITLVNRGAVTAPQPQGSATVEFTWEWIGGDDKLYRDVLAVCFRTNGKQRSNGEVEDGLAVKFAGHGQTLSVETFSKDQVSSKLLARIPLKLEKAKKYRVKIVEEGGDLNVFVDDMDVPVLFARVPAPNGNLVMIYNREQGGGGKQVSLLTDVVLK